ncbi:unnamed protein product [Urochloa humidicola]
MAPPSKKIPLKLLVDTKRNKVRFAEAGKEFVDFVFNLLTLPIGSLAKLVSAGTMHGGVGRLYQSVEDIGAPYLQPGADKSDLLKPRVLHPGVRKLLLLQGSGNGEPPLPRFRLYTCAGHCGTATMEAKAVCPLCKETMATEVAFVLLSVPTGAGMGGVSLDHCRGYVKEMTSMVTDGLEVTPMSDISGIALKIISRFSVREYVELAQKVVTVGMAEGLAILKASLHSDTVLTDVFLAGKK